MTRAIIGAGKERYATEVYESIYQLASLRRQCLAALSGCDALLTPTAGKHFSLNELEADPVDPNRLLGHYTNYMNLLDMCGLAIPGLDTASNQPFGVTLVADRFQDARLQKSFGLLRDNPDLNQDLSHIHIRRCRRKTL